MTAPWERMYRLFIEPDNVWHFDRWDAKALRYLNENVWITQNLEQRTLSGDTDADWILWADQMARPDNDGS